MKIGQTISKILTVGQLISKFTSAQGITNPIEISSQYVKKKKKVGQVISKISKLDQLISKFHSASEITPLVQFLCF
jgi:hypothetical protein